MLIFASLNASQTRARCRAGFQERASQLFRDLHTFNFDTDKQIAYSPDFKFGL